MTPRSYSASKNITKKTAVNFLKKNTRNKSSNGIGKIKEQRDANTVKKLKTNILLDSKNDYNENTLESSPKSWEIIYNEIKKMRETIASNAPVDTMGCDVAADKDVDAKTSRLQTLISLMLSSQTKDSANHIVMNTLKQKLPGGLTLKSLIEVDENLLNDYIRPVGFHNRKAKYIKETVKILEKDYDGDIPSTIKDLVALPGVGLKMAHLCLSSAWNKTEGIGVDVHVHRISNLLGWVNTKTPEQTRLKLESWLPKKYWKEINHLFVGFGQTICLPRGRKCSQCTLSSQKLCPSSIEEKDILSKNLYEKDTENRNNTSSLKNKINNEYKIIDVEDLI